MDAAPAFARVAARRAPRVHVPRAGLLSQEAQTAGSEFRNPVSRLTSRLSLMLAKLVLVSLCAGDPSRNTEPLAAEHTYCPNCEEKASSLRASLHVLGTRGTLDLFVLRH